MQPLSIVFKIINIGNGKFLTTKNEVSNLIVDVINRNPSQPSNILRQLTIKEFQEAPAAQKVLTSNENFFIQKVSDVEIAITYLPKEKDLTDQFYTQWRFIQVSEPYKLVQYLDEDKVVVYSDRTKVIHTIKLDKTISVVVNED
ncbi:hypothetical protein [Pedobacter gandavensis]|uniref:hypothetical protein n=1 Tax=Pedobacter gandavensis TaxID=2679963 RepID=UPI002931A4AE|nr:hypothetical protein [Pedobacter gandavensis]